MKQQTVALFDAHTFIHTGSIPANVGFNMRYRAKPENDNTTSIKQSCTHSTSLGVASKR